MELVQIFSQDSWDASNPFGCLSLPQGENSEKGRYYRLTKEGDGRLLSTGEYHLQGTTGHLGPVEAQWPLRANLLDWTFAHTKPANLGLRSWTDGNQTFNLTPRGTWVLSLDGESIRELTLPDLEPEIFPSLVRDNNRNYYWSSDWSPDFYKAQARAGFIAITIKRGTQVFLLPELQRSYALLDWKNLQIDRQVAKLLTPEKQQELGYRLEITTQVDSTLTALAHQWGKNSWLRGPYTKLMRQLSEEPPETGPGAFALWSVNLQVGSETAAGELGYVIGKTYTSLTGWFDRTRPEWNNFGKLQLVLLAQHLQAAGFAFWNLGHPCMEYKLRLGAKVIPRKEFLERWGVGVGSGEWGVGQLSSPVIDKPQ